MKTYCEAKVYVPEELRLRRGYGFRRHYSAKRCSHYATENGLCTMHAKMETHTCITRIPDWPVHPRKVRTR